MDRSSRNLSIITLVVLAIFLALNNVATRAALTSWGAVVIILLVALAIWFYDRVSRRGVDDSEASETVIEPLIYDHASASIAIPDSIQAAAPVIVAAPVVASTPAPVVTAPAPAPEPVKAIEHSDLPSAPMHEEDARAPMPSSVMDATPPPVMAVDPPQPPVTTTIEEKAAPPPSAPAAETHPELAAKAPEGANLPSVPVSATDTQPVPTSVSGSAPEPVTEAPKTSRGKGKAKPAASTQAAAAPTKPDDLKVVEGIGPKMEKALNAAGISTFAQLAAASEDQINAAIVAAGMRFAPSVPTWSQQAGFAAKGDVAGLEAFQKTLAGGRKAK